MFSSSWKKPLNSGINRTNNGLAQLYPVGSIYLSVNDTNPSTFIGGTWERIKDRFLLAAGDKYVAGSTGGEEQHKLTTSEMPPHQHQLIKDTAPSATSDGKIKAEPAYYIAQADVIRDGKYHYPSYTAFEGGNKPHNNMPPYLAVYMWVRTA